MIRLIRHRFQRLPITGDPGDLLQIRIMDETGGRCEDIDGALFQASMILIWIDRLISVAHMSSCAFTQDHDGHRMQTAFNDGGSL